MHEMQEEVEERVEDVEHDLVTDLAERMKPRDIDMGTSNNQSQQLDSQSPQSPPTHQFFHLHHMKSGGTSLSSWIRCGQSRLGGHLASAALSECGATSYHRCIDNETDGCRKRIDDAVTMNFCSPLAVTNYFKWADADAVTMMRHPVDRVWSMFRFQTKSCFKCTDLKQVYKDMDEGNTDKYGPGICLPQLSNHITRNLQKNIDVKNLDTINLSDSERVADAIDSIQNRFTVVGVIERLQESIELFSYSFPWLSEEMEGVQKKCPFPHSNASPSNNHCGEDGGDWDLPNHPDDDTRKAIEEHNQLDIKVYEAALQHFQLQKQAMILNSDEDIQ